MDQPTENKNYRWNFTVNLLDGFSFWFASSFISASTIFPLFISKLTPSLLPIALVSVITSAGWFLPQLFFARITEQFKNKKAIIVGWGLILERVPFLVLIAAAFLARYSSVASLILFLISITWWALGAGVVATAWMALIAKIFTAEKRGSFLGMTMFIGGGVGVLGSIMSAWILENYTFPNSFIVLFSIAAVFMILSWFFLALTREPEAQERLVDQDLSHYKRDLISILKKDHNYRKYVLSNMIITFGGMGVGFITISAIQRFQVTDATVGLYTLTMLIGQTLGNLILGWMADRLGHKRSLEIGVSAMVIAFLLVVIMPTPAYYFIVYFLLGINLSSGIVSAMLIVWEFCDTARVPTYAGLANTSRGLVGLLAPLIAAQIAGVGFHFLFGICCLLTLIGLIFLHFNVKEPRWHQSHRK